MEMIHVGRFVRMLATGSKQLAHHTGPLARQLEPHPTPQPAENLSSTTISFVQQ